MRVLLLLLLVGFAAASSQGPEIGDVVANAEMVATFEHNEPNIVVAPTGHRRHYRIATPYITFGEETVNLISDGSLGFFSSYERKEAQAVILLQAKHDGANTTLGCLMPGTAFETGEDTPDDPLYPFESMMTCNLQIHGASHGPETVRLTMDVTSMQNDRVLVHETPKFGGVILRREDTLHILRVVVAAVGNSTLSVAPYPTKARLSIDWDGVIPADGINTQFHVFIVSSSAKNILHDEWMLAIFLAVAFLVISIGVFACNFIKHVILDKDAQNKRNQRAVSSSPLGRNSMLSLVSTDQIAAAQSVLLEQQARHV